MGDVTLNEVLGYVIAAVVVAIIAFSVWVWRPNRKPFSTRADRVPTYPQRGTPPYKKYAGEDDDVGPITSTRRAYQRAGDEDDPLINANAAMLGAIASSDARPSESHEPGLGGGGLGASSSFGGDGFSSGGGDSSSGSGGGDAGGGND